MFGTLSIGSTSIPVKDFVGIAVNKELESITKELSANWDAEEDDSKFIPADQWTMKKLVLKIRELCEQKQVALISYLIIMHYKNKMID